MNGREITAHTITQCDMILDHMKRYGSITQAEAMSEYGCYRLAARISDLKVRGWKIRKEAVKKKNRFGKTIVFARYSFEKEAV